MLFTREYLEQEKTKIGFEKTAELLKEASQFKVDGTYDIFLSHRFEDLDEDDLSVIIRDIKRMGKTVYIDSLEDPVLEREFVTKETANVIRSRMGKCKALFFALSEHYLDSSWMTWELGYFDGKKGKVAILPVFENIYSEDDFVENEYLGIYPYIEMDYISHIRLGKHLNSINICRSEDKKTDFDQWLKTNNF